VTGRLLMSTTVLIGSLAISRLLSRRGWLTPRRAQRLLYLDVKRLAPVTLCLLFWRMNLRDVQMWWLPVIGLAVTLSTMLPAIAYARWKRLTRPQAGSFLACAIFSNVGYLGAFLLFARYGESAYALATLYYLSFTPLFYVLGFSVGKRFGHAPGSIGSPGADELRLYPFLGLCAGLLLSLSGIPRPAVCASINRWLIPIDTALYLLAIGSQLRFELPPHTFRDGLAMSAIKFLYSPLVAWGLLTLCRIQGMPRAVAIFEASMPVAISPLMLPMLFGLDQALANALWMWTTLLAIPVIVVLLGVVGRL